MTWVTVHLVCLGCVPSTARASVGTASAVTVQQTYDGNGNVLTRTDGNGAQTAYAYDARNRLISVDYPGGSSPDVTFAYDQNGNRTQMTDATGTTSYDFDLFDRLVEIDYPDGGFVKYGYDNVGNITDLLYGNFAALVAQGAFTYVQYTFDADNRISTVKNVFTGHTASYTYDAAGSVSRRTLPNGVYCDYSYDADGRLVGVSHRKSDQSLIVGYQYTLNAIGQRTQVVETSPTEAARTTSYTYDALDRLDTVTYPDGRFVDYDYDSFGNRTKTAETIGATTTVRNYVYDSDSRLLSTTKNGAAEETFTYDQTGNLLQRVRVTDSRQIDYVYDLENRLVRYFDGTNNVEYVYDGIGERVAKVVNGVRTNFVNDPNRPYIQVLAETDTAGVASRVYEWGNELLNQEDITGTTRNYYLQDSPLGSVRRVVNAGAAVVNSYEYDAFGKPTMKTEGVANDYQFHGEVQEEETGLLFLRVRQLDCETGRFLTRDPLPGDSRVPQSMAPYVFVRNDPVGRRDPTGLRDDWDAFLDDIGRSSADISVTYGNGGLRTRAGIEVFTTGDVRGVVRGGNSWGTSWGNVGWRIDPTSGRLSASAGGREGIFTWSVSGSDRLRAGVGMSLPNGGWGIELGASTPYSFLRWNPFAVGSALAQRMTNNLIESRPGGVALNRSASVLLDINTLTGGTYDPATGQILLFGKQDTSPTALPKMSLDDLAVAFSAVQQGSMPVVSIEDPVVQSPPEWPGRACFTVRYGPFYTDPADGQRKVLDLTSKTHFGWVMFDADRHMKCLGLGKDNRTGAAVSSSVAGYKNMLDLGLQYFASGNTTTRFWFNPKTIEIVPSVDGKSMELRKAEMQLSTETMFSSAGQVESTPDAEYFASWFTTHYDAIANEQITYDGRNQPHYIFKELKQLAAIVGVVKWIQENNVPVDLSFLKNYTPAPYPEAMAYTPQTTASKTSTSGGWTRTVTLTGGVNYCKDLEIGTGGNPTGLAAGALSARPGESSLGWSFTQNGQSYNVSAVSVDRKEKDGGYTRSDVDARLDVKGAMPLVLARHFDSFDVGRTMFGYGWTAQPYALQFTGEPTGFNLCGQQWKGFAEIWFNDRGGERIYRMVASGVYDKTADPLHIAARFDSSQDIVVYRYETKGSPGLLFGDTKTRMTMRLATGTLLDFDLAGSLTKIEDRNGNVINYGYDASRRLASIGQPGGRTITFGYDAQNRATSAALPDSHRVTYSYDTNGNLASAQMDAPNGRKLQYVYNADHDITEVRDEAGNAVETRSYDVYGRVVSTMQPGVTTSLAQTFNLAARTSQATGPDGFAQATEFNEKYDPTKITDARSNSEILTYNSYRDVITEQKADGRIWQYYYDSTGRRIATVQPNGRADVTYFDLNNNPITTFHASADADFDASFDAEHVFTGQSLAAYAVDATDYTYDLKGNLTKVTDANAHERNFGYDAAGNQISAQDGRGNQTDYTYDGYSRRTRTRNPDLNYQTDHAYDERDNLTRVSTRATATTGTLDYTYNSKNERTSVTTGNNGARHTTSYTYNARGQIATVTDPAGKLTEYTYDARGNLTQVKHDGVVRFSYDYDGMNRLAATRYTGTSGGGQAAIVPLSPRGAEILSGSISIGWQAHGDWTGNTLVILQYSTDGQNWTSIATVSYAAGSYAWNTGNLASTSVRIRFLRSGDSAFRSTVTSSFLVLNGGKYYVNDGSTSGDQYCTAAGQNYNGTTVTGLSPASPVNSLQAIIDNYALTPGDTIYVDTGNYSIGSDIVITERDAGTSQKPVTITGPTLGGSAVITHRNPAASSACVVVEDTDLVANRNAENIVIQNLKLTGARSGIALINATDCTVRANECYGNGLDGTAGQDGDGNGIVVLGAGNNTIEHNTCHTNGAAGGAGSGPGMNGGAGRGAGILIDGSSSNQVRFNTCHDNAGMGGAAGSATDEPGYSEGVGIFVQSAGVAADGNQVTDNLCYANDATGRDESAARGGLARSEGIALLQTNNSNIERNTVRDHLATGGVSWNGTSGGQGGWGISYGIYGQDEAGLKVSGNVSQANAGIGGYGGDDADDDMGTGWAAGILLNGCRDALVKNNLCHDNVGSTWGTFGGEPAGMAASSGIEMNASPNGSLLNNTLVQNQTIALPSGGTNRVVSIAAQVYVWGGSDHLVIKNNIFDVAHGGNSALAIESGNTAGTISDSNDFYVRDTAAFGFWGGAACTTLQAWRTAGGQDAASLSVDPRYYDAAASNFHLASTSPLIDAGEILARVQDDADGENRPADGPDADLVAKQDLGYDEFIDADSDGLADAIEQNVTHTRPDATDSDSDGLPDGWEVANHLDPSSALGAQGANGDPDGDGYPNLQEYQGHSNPRLAGSIPPQLPVIASFSPVGSSLFVLEEENVAFSATATDANNDPVSYSWRLDGVEKSAASTWTFPTTNESSGVNTLTKTYQVELRVTAGGDTVTRPWSVSVNNRNHAPVLNPMANITARPGDTITLNPSYSDPDNQNSVPGDDNHHVVLYSGFMSGPARAVTPADGGLHAVTVTVQDDGLPAQSASQSIQILVIVDAAPVVTTQPANQTATIGGEATFTVAASGTPAPAYQWRKGGAAIAGATDATLTLAQVQPGAAGRYDVVVTNSAGSATSDVATLTVAVTATAPTISAIPNQSIVVGGSTGALAFTVGDAETPATDLTVSGASSNPALVPTAGIVFGGGGASRTVTVTPAPGQSGTATITITVSDGLLSASKTFDVSISAQPLEVVLLGWDFAGEPGNQAASVSTTVFSSFLPGTITRGPGLSAAADADSFNSTGWATTSNLGTANTDGDYLAFTLTPNPGVVYSISKLIYKATAPSSGSPDSFALRSSLDGFASNLRTNTIVVLPTAVEVSFDLNSVTSLQNVTSAITFRLVGGSAGSAIASFRLEGAGDDLQILGTTVIDAHATHSVAGGGYFAGSTVTIANLMTYTGTLSDLQWSVLLPAGWSYASGSGSEGDVKPVVGDTSLLEWAWTTIPASPVTFSYTLNVPAGETGTKDLAALVLPRQSGTQFQVLVQPDPLAIDQVTHHAADANRDFRISLTELLRVIELYNTRYGTVRTGAYVVDAGNLEDGFGTDPARSNTAVVTLTRYHSGDLNHDAKLSLTELLRVIELYNTRSGTVRTGQYHPQPGTEDGFDTGP